MSNFNNLCLCVTCGTQYDIPFDDKPATCRMCNVYNLLLQYANNHANLVLGASTVCSTFRTILDYSREAPSHAQKPVQTR